MRRRVTDCAHDDRHRQRLRRRRGHRRVRWWRQVSTDSLMGGKSEASMRIADGGANGTKRSLEITGTIAAGSPYPWSGAMFFPASTPMAPANLSRFKEIVFWARGDGGNINDGLCRRSWGTFLRPTPLSPGPEWRRKCRSAGVAVRARWLGHQRRSVLGRRKTWAVQAVDRRSPVPVIMADTCASGVAGIVAARLDALRVARLPLILPGLRLRSPTGRRHGSLTALRSLRSWCCISGLLGAAAHGCYRMCSALSQSA